MPVVGMLRAGARFDHPGRREPRAKEPVEASVVRQVAAGSDARQAVSLVHCAARGAQLRRSTIEEKCNAR